MDTKDQRDVFLDSIYRRYALKLENFCLQFVGYAEEYRGIVDESVQNTFLQAVRKYEELYGYTDSHIEAWLMDVCRKRLTTALRTYRRRRKRLIYISAEEKLYLPADRTVDIANDFLSKQSSQLILERLLSTFNARERKILEDRLLKNESFETIAKRENTSVGAIKAVLARLRSKAKKAVANNPQDFFIFFVSFLLLTRFKK